MAASISLYNSASEILADGTIDLDDDTIRVALTNTTFDADHTQLSNITEHANGTGYTTGGAALVNQTWTRTDNVTALSADNISWTATGGNLSATGAAIYSDTAGNDDLLGYINFDGTKTALTGEDLIIQWPVDGIITVSVP